MESRPAVRSLQGKQMATGPGADSIDVRGIGRRSSGITARTEAVQAEERTDGDVERPAGFLVDPEGGLEDQRQRLRNRERIGGFGCVQAGEFGVVAPVGHAAVHGVEFGFDGRPDGRGVRFRTADADGPAGPEGFAVEGPGGVGGWGAGGGERREREQQRAFRSPAASGAG